MPEEGVDDADVLLFKADYTRDGLKLGAAYLDPGSNWSATALTASYDFGQFSLGGGWQREDSIGGIRGNDRDSYTLGAAFQVAPSVTLKAQFVTSDADASDSDATQWAVGLDYQWDPALTLYVAYASTSNDDNAAFSANNWGKGDAVFPAAGQNPNAVSVGIVYRFGVAIGK